MLLWPQVMDWGLALPEEHRVKMVGSGEHTGPLADDFPRWATSLTPSPRCCAAEVAENIASVQLHIAFTRGAAKQYNV